MNDHLKLSNSINERKLTMVSRLVETFSGIRISGNKPIIGENVFTQCSGIHADGDNKDNLYYNDLLPERFRRTRKYALGKTSGKANISKNLEEMGIRLDAESLKRVTDKVIELADKKESVTSEDLPYILSDVLKSESIFEKITLRNYAISHALGLRPMATVSIEMNGDLLEEAGSGDGQYDAFMNALHKIYQKLNKQLPVTGRLYRYHSTWWKNRCAGRNPDYLEPGTGFQNARVGFRSDSRCHQSHHQNA